MITALDLHCRSPQTGTYESLKLKKIPHRAHHVAGAVDELILTSSDFS
jgi:hypothetical protein